MINVCPNILSPEDCRSIIRRGEWFRKISSSFDTQDDNKIKRAFVQPFIKGILKKIESNFPQGKYSAELVRYDVGSKNADHCDVKGGFPLGFFNTPEMEWKYTGIILLNTDFEGGTLYFPNRRRSFSKESIGSLILFPAGNNFNLVHGVTPITSGKRFTLVLRFI